MRPVPDWAQLGLALAWAAGVGAAIWWGSIEIIVVTIGWSLVLVAALYAVSTF